MRRRKSREYALQMLFQLDFTRKHIDTFDFKQFWENKEGNHDIRQFAEELFHGTLEKLSAIDASLERIADNWVLDRMAAVDRAILRFAAYEILYRKDIPSAVTMNEAIEIAKKYSSSESAAFLNGVLDRLARDTGK